MNRTINASIDNLKGSSNNPNINGTPTPPKNEPSFHSWAGKQHDNLHHDDNTSSLNNSTIRIITAATLDNPSFRIMCKA